MTTATDLARAVFQTLAALAGPFTSARRKDACKPGETSASTGCTPASGEGGAAHAPKPPPADDWSQFYEGGWEARQPKIAGARPTVDEIADHVLRIEDDASPQERAELLAHLRTMPKEELKELQQRFYLHPFKRDEDAAAVLAEKLTTRLTEYQKLARETFQAGVPFKALNQTADELLALHKQQRNDVAEMLKEAKKQFEHYTGEKLTRGHPAFHGGDPDGLPAWDVIADSLAARHPDLLNTNGGESAERLLYDHFLAGVPPAPTRVAAQREALGILRGQYANPQEAPAPQGGAPEYDDEVPF